jgi:hypothetical protein
MGQINDIISHRAFNKFYSVLALVSRECHDVVVRQENIVGPGHYNILGRHESLPPVYRTTRVHKDKYQSALSLVVQYGALGSLRAIINLVACNRTLWRSPMVRTIKRVGIVAKKHPNDLFNNIIHIMDTTRSNAQDYRLKIIATNISHSGCPIRLKVNGNLKNIVGSKPTPHAIINMRLTNHDRYVYRWLVLYNVIKYGDLYVTRFSKDQFTTILDDFRTHHPVEYKIFANGYDQQQCTSEMQDMEKMVAGWMLDYFAVFN